MRTLPALSLIVALVAAAAGPAAARPLRSVKVADDYFVRDGSPPTIRVARGTRVTFRWRGSSLHDVHARRGPVTFRSNYMRRGSFSKVLRRRGTYTIVCDIHQPDMRLTITVR